MKEESEKTSAQGKVIGPYSYEEYLDAVRRFHGHIAPGMVIGGFMVDLAQKNLPPGELFDAFSETRACLPDAVQLLTPCTVGNGWLTILDFGRFALTLYDKFTGQGTRVSVDAAKLAAWPEVNSWFFKLKSKKEQPLDLLMDEIRRAGASYCRVERVQVRPELLGHTRRKGFALCPDCGESYPKEHGSQCRSCQGRSPYARTVATPGPERELRSVDLDQAAGLTALHDMTRILPGKEKGPAFLKGQTIADVDLCRLQKMGRGRIFTAEHNPEDPDWVHEDQAALAFARALSGKGVSAPDPPREGKARLVAEIPGLLTVDQHALEAFNSVEGVAAAGRRAFSVVKKGEEIAGTRALPLYLHTGALARALEVLQDRPVYAVHPMRRARTAILVTGTEVFTGLVQDRFSPVIEKKVKAYGCEVVASRIVPDDRQAISQCAREMIEAGADLLVTTAGLSVDPDDVTRKGLEDAGAMDLLFGAPILPGNMTLIARMGTAQVIGVPACALFHHHTSFDILLPRLLANLPITRADLATLGHGAFCLNCKTCHFPNCAFGS